MDGNCAASCGWAGWGGGIAGVSVIVENAAVSSASTARGKTH